MRLLSSVIVFALVGLLAATVVVEVEVEFKNAEIILKDSFYKQKFVKYEGKHDIVKILSPVQALNNKTSSSQSQLNDILVKNVIFFVQADIQTDGSLVDQGLYVLKEGKATKLLEHGRDAAASVDDSKLVFFGAKDGLYVYNQNTNSADKYGPITDSIIEIVKEKKGGAIYILTENREVYKVTNNGETKEKLEDLVNAQQIILDNSNNLYFYSDDKVPYVLTNTGIKKIEGLPVGYSSILLVKPTYILKDQVMVILDNNAYYLRANGTSARFGLTYDSNAKPTAFAPEAAFIQYYAHNKKIYGYTFWDMISLFAPSEDLSEKEPLSTFASTLKRKVLLYED